MTLIDNLRSQLIRDEGEILYAYPDSKGYWTIGVGHLIDKRKGGGISHEISNYILDDDIAHKLADLFQHLPWAVTLDEARQGVLANMVFNLGVEGLLEFENTLALIQSGDYSEAAKEMLQSKWATDVGDRAQRLSEQMATGRWM